MFKELTYDYTVYSQDLKLLKICTYPQQAQGNHENNLCSNLKNNKNFETYFLAMGGYIVAEI